VNGCYPLGLIVSHLENGQNELLGLKTPVLAKDLPIPENDFRVVPGLQANWKAIGCELILVEQRLAKPLKPLN
jgi:hypothetical protein